MKIVQEKEKRGKEALLIINWKIADNADKKQLALEWCSTSEDFEAHGPIRATDRGDYSRYDCSPAPGSIVLAAPILSYQLLASKALISFYGRINTPIMGSTYIYRIILEDSSKDPRNFYQFIQEGNSFHLSDFVYFRSTWQCQISRF